MARYIRIAAPAAAAAPSGADDDLATALRGLAPVGSLAKLAGGLTSNPDLGAVGGGLSGLASLTRGIAGGDPGQAIGGAANLGGSLASVAGYPGIASGLGAVGGPLTLATGLASGDPLSSTLGGLQTGSLVSGALGGPTISSGLSALYPLLQSIGPAAAEGIGAAGAGAGAGVGAGIMGGGLGASMAGMAALAPIALFLMGGLHSAFGGGGDMFDAMFGNVKTPAQKQYEEFKKASDEFPGLAQRRVAGADLFSHLGDYDTPDEVTSGLQIASSGRSAEPESAAFNLQHPGSAIFPKVQPVNLDAWNAAAPGLAGKNWGSFLGLMDRGEGMGLDPGGMTGDWKTDVVNDAGVFKPGVNLTGEDYRTRPSMTYDQTMALASGDESQRAPHGPTQELQDLGNAVSGMAQHLGLDLHKTQPGWDANGLAIVDDYSNFDADQLKDYGFSPGSYGPASLNYLRSYDPSVTQRPEWASYVSALDPTNALADLDPLTLRPYKKPENPFAMLPQSELNIGGF
jgi:hypothetical protein